MQSKSHELLRYTQPRDAQALLGQCLRLERQRQMLTLPMLASKSGVPVATLSRLERFGQGSLDAWMRALFALDQLEALNDFLQQQRRLASLPRDLSELETPRLPRPRQRVRAPGKRRP